MRIKAQKIPRKQVKSEDILIEFCLYFPAYRYSQARKVPYKRLIKMVNAAKKKEAKLLIELTRIAAAPKTKKGAGVKSLISRYEAIINS